MLRCEHVGLDVPTLRLICELRYLRWYVVPLASYATLFGTRSPHGLLLFVDERTLLLLFVTIRYVALLLLVDYGYGVRVAVTGLYPFTIVAIYRLNSPPRYVTMPTTFTFTVG